MTTAPRRPRLGDLAVRKGFANEDEIQAALDMQSRFEPSADRSTARVGEILVEMGALTEEMLKALLEEQEQLERRAASSETPAAADPAPDPGHGRLLVKSAVSVTINGRPIDGPAALRPGDVLRIGTAVLCFEGTRPGPQLVPAEDAPPAPEEDPGVLVRVSDVAKKGLRSVHDVTTRLFRRKAEPGDGGPPSAAPSEGLGPKLKRTGEAVRTLLARRKKGPKDRQAAYRRRDELLQEVGRAALRRRVDLPEAAAVEEAQKFLDQVEHSTSLRGSAVSPAEVSAQRQAIRAARERVDTTLIKLGWKVLESNLEVPDTADALREVRELDATLAE